MKSILLNDFNFTKSQQYYEMASTKYKLEFI